MFRPTLAIGTALLLSLGSVWADGWKAGVARVNITPVEPMWMAGYAARTRPADGKIHDLWIRVLALEDSAGERAIILSSDVVGISRNVADNIRARLGDEFERDALMLNASHTHSGPVMARMLDDLYPLDDVHRQRVQDYTQSFEEKAAQAIREALGRLAPVQLSCGQGNCTFAVNRRNNPELDVPALRKSDKIKGPHDHSVPTLAVHQEDGKLLAVVFAYACHNTVLDSYQWCGDYAGFAQNALEEKHPGTTALFVMGCGGDQNPIPRRQLDLARQYGVELTDSVNSVLASARTPLRPELSTRMEIVSVDLADVYTQDSIAPLTQSGADYQKRWAQRLAADLAAGRSLVSSYPVPVQVWRLGDQVWIAMGGEVVVDYALKFKSLFGENVWVTGYANDVMAYIPSRRVLAEGGYEGQTSMVAYGMPAPRWHESIEDRLTASVARLLMTNITTERP